MVERIANPLINETSDFRAARPRVRLTWRSTGYQRNINPLEEGDDSITHLRRGEIEPQRKALEVVGVRLQRPWIEIH